MVLGVNICFRTSERVSRWLWLKRGDRRCSMLLGHKLVSDHHWLGRPGEGDQRPETPDDPGFFTDDMFNSYICTDLCFLKTYPQLL